MINAGLERQQDGVVVSVTRASGKIIKDRLRLARLSSAR